MDRLRLVDRLRLRHGFVDMCLLDSHGFFHAPRFTPLLFADGFVAWLVRGGGGGWLGGLGAVHGGLLLAARPVPAVAPAAPAMLFTFTLRLGPGLLLLLLLLCRPRLLLLLALLVRAPFAALFVALLVVSRL